MGRPRPAGKAAAAVGKLMGSHQLGGPALDSYLGCSRTSIPLLTTDCPVPPVPAKVLVSERHRHRVLQ